MEQHAHRRQQHREQGFQNHRQQQTDSAAIFLRSLNPDQHHAEQLGQEQQRQRRGEQRNRLLWMPPRPQRIQLVGLQEVLRNHQRMDRQQPGGQRQEGEPQRRRQVGHHPGEEHEAVHRVHALDQEQPEIHQVAVAPAAVTFELVEQVRRQLFVAAGQVVGDPHAPAGTAHQRCLDEIVGEDVAGEGTLARQRCQRAVLDEGFDPDDRVMPPVMRLAQLPEIEPRGEQRPIDPRGELLHARVERVHAGSLGPCLDDAGAGIGFHQPHQAGQAVTAHHAVGIQHHHVAIAAAPAPAEVVDVAALALHPAPAAAIEDMAETIHIAAQLQPGLLLGHAGVGIVAVAEHEDIEVLDLARGQQRLVGRPQPGEHPRYVLVGDGHHQRRTRLGRNRFVARAGGGNVVAITPL